MIVSINRLSKVITIDGNRVKIRFINNLRELYSGFSIKYGKVNTRTTLNGYCKEIYIL
jgi:hypothetical protein